MALRVLKDIDFLMLYALGKKWGMHMEKMGYRHIFRKI